MGAPSPTGNPGSATDICVTFVKFYNNFATNIFLQIYFPEIELIKINVLLILSDIKHDRTAGGVVAFIMHCRSVLHFQNVTNNINLTASSNELSHLCGNFYYHYTAKIYA